MNNNLSNIVGLPLAPCLEREEFPATLDHKTMEDLKEDYHYLPNTVMYSIATRSVIAMLHIDLPLGSTRRIEACAPITLFTEVDYTDDLPCLLFHGGNNTVQATVMIWADKLRYNDGIDRPMGLVKPLKTMA